MIIFTPYPSRIPPKLTMMKSPFGWIGFWGQDKQVFGVKIGLQNRPELETAIQHYWEYDKECNWVTSHLQNEDWYPELKDRLTSWLEGECVNFYDMEIVSPATTAFTQRVLVITHALSYGATLSYGDLALKIGSPKAARAVGNVMKTNRVPILIPCHRVIGSQGELRGFNAPTGVHLKQKFLMMEEIGTSDPDKENSSQD